MGHLEKQKYSFLSSPQPWHDVESKQLYWEQLTGKMNFNRKDIHFCMLWLQAKQQRRPILVNWVGKWMISNRDNTFSPGSPTGEDQEMELQGISLTRKILSKCSILVMLQRKFPPMQSSSLQKDCQSNRFIVLFPPILKHFKAFESINYKKYHFF